jgi:dTMP kinase
MARPRFITLEGIDGSGKSTQVRALAAFLRGRGATVVETREPGGAPGAETIRRLLVEGEAWRWSPETEILLFTAARRDHLERTIRPALDRGETVISDRFADSTRVYQGVARGELRGLVDALHALAIGIEPDLTIVIDMDPKVALHRGLARGRARTGSRASARISRRGCARASSRSPPSSRSAAGSSRVRSAEEVSARIAAVARRRARERRHFPSRTGWPRRRIRARPRCSTGRRRPRRRSCRRCATGGCRTAG